MPAPGPAGGAAIGSWGEGTLTPWRRTLRAEADELLALISSRIALVNAHA